MSTLRVLCGLRGSSENVWAFLAFHENAGRSPVSCFVPRFSMQHARGLPRGRVVALPDLE